MPESLKRFEMATSIVQSKFNTMSAYLIDILTAKIVVDVKFSIFFLFFPFIYIYIYLFFFFLSKLFVKS